MHHVGSVLIGNFSRDAWDATFCSFEIERLMQRFEVRVMKLYCSGGDLSLFFFPDDLQRRSDVRSKEA